MTADGLLYVELEQENAKLKRLLIRHLLCQPINSLEQLRPPYY